MLVGGGEMALATRRRPRVDVERRLIFGCNSGVFGSKSENGSTSGWPISNPNP
jgi:hypothetical protein